eukprot:UN11313
MEQRILQKFAEREENLRIAEANLHKERDNIEAQRAHLEHQESMITVEKTKSDEHTECMEKERRALAELIQEKSSEHDQKLEAMQNALSNDRKELSERIELVQKKENELHQQEMELNRLKEET